MKRVYFYLALLLLLSPAISTYAGEGNGAPSGAHYNLNIIGVPKDKTADMDDNSGHRIFVSLQGRTKIMLGEGEEFRVLDANGTDHDGAMFQLPNPDPDGDGVTVYSVWVRALGKPGGLADMTTCAYDEDDSDPNNVVLVKMCSMYELKMERKKGHAKFSNASEILYVYADLDGNGSLERYPLFDAALQDYFWDYDNNGLKLAQFRFYEMPSTVLDPGDI